MNILDEHFGRRWRLPEECVPVLEDADALLAETG